MSVWFFVFSQVVNLVELELQTISWEDAQISIYSFILSWRLSPPCRSHTELGPELMCRTWGPPTPTLSFLDSYTPVLWFFRPQGPGNFLWCFSHYAWLWLILHALTLKPIKMGDSPCSGRVSQVSTPFWNHLHLSTLQYLQVFVVLFLFFCVCILSRVYSCYLWEGHILLEFTWPYRKQMIWNYFFFCLLV